jgi:hypothetical protein
MAKSQKAQIVGAVPQKGQKTQAANAAFKSVDGKIASLRSRTSQSSSVRRSSSR